MGGGGERGRGRAAQQSKQASLVFFKKGICPAAFFRAILTYLILKLKPFFYLKKKKKKTLSFSLAVIQLYVWGDSGRGRGKGRRDRGKIGDGGGGEGRLGSFWGGV